MMDPVNCDWCHCSFVPTPDSFVETGFGVFPETEDWQGPQEPVGGLDITNIPEEQKAELKEAMQLDDEQLTQLLKEGVIDKETSCLCPDCLDTEGCD